jgi:hypothetical protein
MFVDIDAEPISGSTIMAVELSVCRTIFFLSLVCELKATMSTRAVERFWYFDFGIDFLTKSIYRQNTRLTAALFRTIFWIPPLADFVALKASRHFRIIRACGGFVIAAIYTLAYFDFPLQTMFASFGIVISSCARLTAELELPSV